MAKQFGGENIWNLERRLIGKSKIVPLRSAAKEENRTPSIL